MKHILALIIKFAINAMVLVATLANLTNLSVINILYIALVVTAVAYLAGDLFILDKTNNTIATIADAGLAFFIIWAFNFIFIDAVIPFSAALIAALAVGVGEWFFHKYVKSAVFPNLDKI